MRAYGGAEMIDAADGAVANGVEQFAMLGTFLAQDLLVFFVLWEAVLLPKPRWV